MADAQATFSIELDTQGVVRPSDTASEALEKLKQKILADNQALAGMTAAMRNIQRGSSVNIDAFKKLKDGIAAHKQSIANASADFVNLGGKLSDLAKKSDAGGGGFKNLGEAANVAGGPLGRMIRGVDLMKGKFTGLNAAALLAVAGVVALTAAVVAAVAAFFSLGVAAADAGRAEMLHLQGITTIRNWFGIAAGKASDLRDAINSVSSSSALGRDKISGYAEQLYKMGLRGDALNDALDATAIKASVQGDEWASLFMQMAAGANMTGQSVKKLADDVRTRLGGIAKAQALGLGVQLSKLHENIRALFQDAKIDGFLSALNEVTSLFSQSTYTGQALKMTIDGLFTPLFGDMKAGGTIAKRFFQGLIIGTQESIIAVMKLALWIKRTFGGEGIKKTLIKEALDMGIVSIYVFLGAAALLVAAVAAIGAIFYAVFFKLPKIVGEFLGDVAYALVQQVGTWIEGGKLLVEGIWKGITTAWAWMLGKFDALVAMLPKAVKKVLGITSPSRVFAELGVNIPKGLAQGIEAGKDEAADAVVSIAAPRGTVGAGMAAAAGASPITVGDLHYHAGPGETPERAKENGEAFALSFQQTLEGLAIRMGAAA